MLIKNNHNISILYLILLISGIYTNAASSSGQIETTKECVSIQDLNKTIAQIFHDNPVYNTIVGQSVFGKKVVIRKYAHIIHSNQCRDIDLSKYKLPEIFTLFYAVLNRHILPTVSKGLPTKKYSNPVLIFTLPKYRQAWKEGFYVEKLDENSFSIPVNQNILHWSLSQLYSQVSLAIRDYFDGDYLFTLRLTHPDGTRVQPPDIAPFIQSGERPDLDWLNQLAQCVTPGIDLVCTVLGKIQVKEDTPFNISAEMEGHITVEDLTGEIDRMLMYNNKSRDVTLYSGNAEVKELGVGSRMNELHNGRFISEGMEFQVPSEHSVTITSYLPTALTELMISYQNIPKALTIPIFVNGVFDDYFYTDFALDQLGIKRKKGENTPLCQAAQLLSLHQELKQKHIRLLYKTFARKIHVVQDNDAQNLRDILLRGCLEEGDLNILQTWLDKFRAHNINICIDADQMFRTIEGYERQRGWDIWAYKDPIPSRKFGIRHYLNYPTPPFSIDDLHDYRYSFRHGYRSSSVRDFLLSVGKYNEYNTVEEYNKLVAAVESADNHTTTDKISWVALSDNWYTSVSLVILLSPANDIFVVEYGV